MNETISLDDTCTKCGVSLRRQMFLALLLDAGAQSNEELEKQLHELEKIVLNIQDSVITNSRFVLDRLLEKEYGPEAIPNESV